MKSAKRREVMENLWKLNINVNYFSLSWRFVYARLCWFLQRSVCLLLKIRLPYTFHLQQWKWICCKQTKSGSTSVSKTKTGVCLETRFGSLINRELSFWWSKIILRLRLNTLCNSLPTRRRWKARLSIARLKVSILISALRYLSVLFCYHTSLKYLW